MSNRKLLLVSFAVVALSLALAKQTTGQTEKPTRSDAPIIPCPTCAPKSAPQADQISDPCPQCRINFGIAGITRTQTMRINVVDPSDVPAGTCRQIEMAFIDSRGNVLRRSSQCLVPGQGVAFELNGASVESSTNRREIRAAVRLEPSGDPDRNRNSIVATVEVFDNDTARTAFLVPVLLAGSAFDGDFSISVNPTSVSVSSGGNASSIVDTTTIAGSAQSVALSASGLPPGASAAFVPSSITSGSSSSITISTGCAQPGSYVVTIIGTGSSATHMTSLSLSIN